jgi:hypothetical protein
VDAGPKSGPAATDVQCIGCVHSGDIGDGEVKSADIGNGEVKSADIGSGEVKSGNLAAGAVTAAKLAADAVYARTVVVRADGSPSANGGALLLALQEIDLGSHAICPDPHVSPCVVKLEPGTYDVGGTPVDMVRFVDIEGSGVGVTEIEGSVASASDGLLNLEDNAAVRHLSLLNSVTSGNAIGIAAIGATGGSAITDVRLRASGDTATGLLCEALGHHHPELDLADVFVAADSDAGDAVAIAAPQWCDLDLFNVRARARVHVFGVGTSAGLASGDHTSVTARQSVLDGDDSARVDAGGSVDLATTQVIGSLRVSLSGSVRCVYAYDSNYLALPAPDCGAIVLP